jgi:hypothetical protein
VPARRIRTRGLAVEEQDVGTGERAGHGTVPPGREAVC